MTSAAAPPVRIGVDIGGTFTDLQIFDARTRAISGLKTLTTPDDPSIGLMTGIRRSAQLNGFALVDVGYLVHGTTIATNAVLERKLAKGALVTTARFEDVVEIGRHYRRQIYSLNPRVPPMLIPRDRRIGIEERIKADGHIETPLTRAAIEQLMRKLDALEVEAVAISLLNSYVNASHEIAIAEAIAKTRPSLKVSCSGTLSPEIREYERTSTTILNALLIPIVSKYLDNLAARMRAEGFAPRLLLVQSNGGVCSVDAAAQEPVRLLLSGPSGGSAACALLGRVLGEANIVGIDMGGTSFDVSVVHEGSVNLIMQGEIDHMPVRLPMVEIRSIGAGGGSIAAVHPGSRLQVGPESAGSHPGPACYGRGGTRPTVTDANVVLGRLDGESFLGGDMRLNSPAARAAISAEIAEPLDLSVEAAAEGVLIVTNSSLGAAIRLSLFEKGFDPREFAMIAFGGAAGLHAVAVAQEIGVKRIVFPENASTLSAYGILHSNLAHDLVRSRVYAARPESLPALKPLVGALISEAHARLEADAVPAGARQITLAADMRYEGQAFELTVPARDSHLDETVLASLIADFHEIHCQRFSYADPGSPVELVSLRVAAIGHLPTPDPKPFEVRGDSKSSKTRKIWLSGALREVAVWKRDQIPLGGTVAGPAVIEEAYTTVLLLEGWDCHRDASGHLSARRASMKSSAPISPIELEIIHNALTAAAAEMDVTIWRTSRSTIVRELLDYSTAVFDCDGRNIAQAARIPIHLNSMSYFLAEILARHIAPDRWTAADVVISNDPYCGGQHLPDIVAFKAVFLNRRRIGFVGTVCHHLDVGGSSPGSYGSSSIEIFQEGLRIPPVKLFERGNLNESVRAIILQNVRQPEILWGDLQSQLASLQVGAASIERLATKVGEQRFKRALKELLDTSEAGMRSVITRIPDGTYEFEDCIDDDGLTDTPVRIHAKLIVAADEMTVDLSGCGPQAIGPSNATLASTCSAVFYVLMASADVPIAANAGCYRPVKIIAPQGLCINAAYPAPVVHRIAIAHRLATVLFGALHQAIPERMPAAYYAVSYVVTFQTVDPAIGRRILVEIEIGGCGALPYSDGASAHSFGMHNNSNIPIEMIESEMPLTFLGYGLLTDSGGAGRQRGGLGLWREWRIDSPVAQLSTNLDRFKFPPFGLAGGGAAAASALYLIRDGRREALPSKVTNVMLRKGDVVRLETSGGGGFGEPKMRADEQVERDVRLGYVSAQAAASSYGQPRPGTAS